MKPPSLVPLEFYHGLPTLETFDAVSEAESYTRIPSGWSALISDVAGSTQAIRDGRYKDVTTLGSSVLAGVFNALGTIDVPFVFGGDGSVVVLPDSLLEYVFPSLDSARRTGREIFDLELRTGIVSLDELAADGFTASVAKLRLSEHNTLAAFSGSALREAERRIREDPTRYQVPAQPGAANLAGLECPWTGIRAPGGVMVSMLVTPASDEESHAVVRQVLAKLKELNPESGAINKAFLSAAALAKKLTPGRRAESDSTPVPKGFFSAAIHRIRTAATRLFEGGRSDDHEYRPEVIVNSDRYKYDGTLRLVLATDPGRRAKLEAWLEEQYRAGRLAYGLHSDPEAIMTCLVANRHGSYLHFLDVNNGGYALAAVELKRRLSALAARAA